MLIWPAAGVFEIFHTIYIVEKSMIKLRKKVEIPTNYFYYFLKNSRFFKVFFNFHHFSRFFQGFLLLFGHFQGFQGFQGHGGNPVNILHN